MIFLDLIIWLSRSLTPRSSNFESLLLTRHSVSYHDLQTGLCCCGTCYSASYYRTSCSGLGLRVAKEKSVILTKGDVRKNRLSSRCQSSVPLRLPGSNGQSRYSLGFPLHSINLSYASRNITATAHFCFQN